MAARLQHRHPGYGAQPRTACWAHQPMPLWARAEQSSKTPGSRLPMATVIHNSTIFGLLPYTCLMSAGDSHRKREKRFPGDHHCAVSMAAQPGALVPPGESAHSSPRLTHALMCTHPPTPTYIHTFTPACTDTHVHTHPYSHTHVHICSH